MAAKRFWEIDALRGIAIIMMVLFHSLWNLKYLDFIEISLYTGFWGLFQKATAGLFLVLVGIVLTISCNRQEEEFRKKFLRRGLKIFSAGMIITVVSLVLFPEQFIYFGILHLIGVSIIISIPVVRKKIASLMIGAVVIILPLFFQLQSLEIPFLAWLGLAPPSKTLDFFPVIPWIGAVLIGIFIGNEFYEKSEAKIKWKEPESIVIKKLQFLGRHSLLIYFLHQPVLFGLMYAATMIL